MMTGNIGKRTNRRSEKSKHKCHIGTALKQQYPKVGGVKKKDDRKTTHERISNSLPKPAMIQPLPFPFRRKRRGTVYLETNAARQKKYNAQDYNTF
jgi:hypothetical protein